MNRSQSNILALAVITSLALQGCRDRPTPTESITPKALQIVSGDGQRARRGGDLAAPLRVRLIGSDDEPLSGTAVQWTVTEGQATIDPAQSTTDPSGEAETRVTLGATLGSVVVRATVADLTPVLFSSTAVDAAAIEIVSGDRQRGGTGRPLFGPLRVRAIASDDLPLEGVTVQWSVSQGQATLDPAQSTTDASGETETRATLGPATGGIAVSATLGDLAPATFSITALEPSAFVSVSAGDNHACGVTAAGDAYCWGWNLYGELGDGTVTVRVNPVLVAGGLNFATISAGSEYTCGVTVDGTGYCWGTNGGGKLGIGTLLGPENCGQTSHGCSSVPVPVAGGLRFSAIDAGITHTCGLTTEGSAYCWGTNEYGQLGLGTNVGPETCNVAGTTCSTLPRAVVGGLRFRTISSGGLSSGVTTAGVAYSWGVNERGQLGIGTATGPESCGQPCSRSPVPVLGGLSLVSVTVGYSHICGLNAGGSAYCWGNNTAGELGVGMTSGPEDCLDGPLDLTCSTSPVPVIGGLSLVSVSSSGFHTCGVTAAGAAHCWGNNSTGALGVGTMTGPETCRNGGTCSTTPLPVAGGLRFEAVSAGLRHSCATTPDGAAYCWGWNDRGQLGDGTTTERLTPVLVNFE